ncbi:zinc finger protein 232 [Homo sapiens]|uniref:Zinc finger protein 232 n=1 Tax=Homo sapiens TaxID=9606 RepID=I3L4H6_HUMAN|nr:zinc finger protein 232 [Homo sapiens]KAI2580806.1 zinc finger protein 232 [Homo sapiens]KAI2580807.1 zinc finger protein 232 [Homo sapiens]KAI4047317.1 zinc finger protein 232 [Homo sapiens]KAI4047318.1 zinc finger protein 232 [Homo sapiens]
MEPPGPVSCKIESNICPQVASLTLAMETNSRASPDKTRNRSSTHPETKHI